MKKTVNRYIRDLSGDASAFQKRLYKQYGGNISKVGKSIEFEIGQSQMKLLHSLIKSERKVEG